MPQVYCVSVYVLWPFGEPQTVVIAKIFLPFPQEPLFPHCGAIYSSFRPHTLVYAGPYQMPGDQLPNEDLQ